MKVNEKIAFLILANVTVGGSTLRIFDKYLDMGYSKPNRVGSDPDHLRFTYIILMRHSTLLK